MKSIVLVFTLIIPFMALAQGPENETYLEVAEIIGPKIDQIKNDRKLSDNRALINADNVDRCFSDDLIHENFSHQTSYFASLMLKKTNAYVGMIGSYYGSPEEDSKYESVSLISHPLCNVSRATLLQTIKKVPTEEVIKKLNVWAQNINALRERFLSGDQEAHLKLLESWSATFSCLAYTESLSSADNRASVLVAKKYAPEGYRKPAAVEFYEDPEQPKVSRLNIGLFQFTPNALGNIRPCIKAWNELHHQSESHCKVSLNASQAELINVLGSSLQSFNAFCGVHKIIETFAIQVNTQKNSATHPQNVKNGRLLSPANRCVSPHFSAAKAYNHFGPFQNSTDNNLDRLYSCVLSTFDN